MSNRKYTKEFKAEAIKKVTERCYKKPRLSSGELTNVFAKRLKEVIEVLETDQTWATDITNQDVCGIIASGSHDESAFENDHCVVDEPTLAMELVLHVLLMPVWQRKPGKGVIMHSD